jgi:hypothetical protein
MSSLALDFGSSVYVGPHGELWLVPAQATIDLPACQVMLSLSTEKGDLVVDEITYRRRPTDPPITPATITTAPLSTVVEMVMLGPSQAAHFGAKIAFLDELGIDWREGDDINALIAEALEGLQPLPDDVATSWKWVEAQDPAKLRRHIRSRRVRRRKLDDRFLAKVAKIYADAAAEGEHAAREVARRLDPNWNPRISHAPKTATRWVKMARNRGLLEETEPRRQGGALLQHPNAE